MNAHAKLSHVTPDVCPSDREGGATNLPNPLSRMFVYGRGFEPSILAQAGKRHAELQSLFMPLARIDPFVLSMPEHQREGYARLSANSMATEAMLNPEKGAAIAVGFLARWVNEKGVAA